MTSHANAHAHPLRSAIEQAWAQRLDSPPPETAKAVEAVLKALSAGELRVAEPDGAGGWRVHEWVKQAILLHFRISSMRTMRAGELTFHDKVGVRTGWTGSAVRVVPPAVVREGAYVAPGAILMPCFVNVGAWIGPGTMIDTWSTVGSCAQVGKNCHISGGVGIGGVLEPVQARPVVIEDNVFIGARSEVAEGTIVREGAVLAMGCYMGASTLIYNSLTGETLRGGIPPRAVVVPGSIPSDDGTYSTYALIIKKYRDERTDARTALNDLLR